MAELTPQMRAFADRLRSQFGVVRSALGGFTTGLAQSATTAAKVDFTAPQVKTSATASPAGTNTTQTVVLELRSTSPVDDVLLELLRKAIRVRGGTGPNSVQVVLGASRG